MYNTSALGPDPRWRGWKPTYTGAKSKVKNGNDPLICDPCWNKLEDEYCPKEPDSDDDDNEENDDTKKITCPKCSHKFSLNQ